MRVRNRGRERSHRHVGFDERDKSILNTDGGRESAGEKRDRESKVRRRWYL